ncbi:MAG: phosphopantetheine-binding protein [Crocinitomicaceae bacterium]
MTAQEFISIVADELMIDSTNINLDTCYRNIPTWTSLNSLLVVSSLHEETGHMITAADLAKFNTLSELYSLVTSK